MKAPIAAKNLDALMSRLTEEQRLVIEEVVRALLCPIVSSVSATSDICTLKFVHAFQSRLIVFQALNDDALSKKAFEYAFASAYRESTGKQVTVNRNSVMPGEDVVADGIKFSMKTEADRSIRSEVLKISKLMEARWIRDCKTGREFLRGVQKNIVPHLNRYDRILVLRAIRAAGSYEYRLVEIPKTVLLQMQNLIASSFSDRTANGTTRALVMADGVELFSLRLDGSVEKVTIDRLRQDACILHGTWIIPASVTATI